MNKNCLLGIVALLFVCCAMLGCGKEEDSSNGGGKGSIYGCVTDFATGEPVRNANVQLLMSGNATLHASITGSDGHYEIPDVPCGTYFIKVTKVGYSDLIDNNPIVIEKDKSTKRDLQIKKLPSSLHIYDNESHEISELNFGADEGVTQKTFNIFNGGEQTLNYVITIPTQANWVSISDSQLTGTIGVNVTYPIIVTIDRELLADGNNNAVLTITSASDGGKELTIKARKSSAGAGVYELSSAGLMVQTEDLGCVDWSSAKLLCENSTVAGYNDWRLPTKEELMTLYSNREMIGGFVDERYWSSSNNGTPYYVDFSNGIAGVYGGNNHYYVRAVRTISGPVTLPTVITGTSTYTSHTAICGGNVISDGGVDITQRGVYYSTSHNPEISGQMVPCSTNGTGSFTCSLTGLAANTTYYYCAYAINAASQAHGEESFFKTKNEYVELPAANLMVQAEDLGEVNWVSAKIMCENSTIGSYNDWRLPTQAELMVLYNNRDYIGGFITTSQSYSKYWSSSTNVNGDPVGVDFYNGSLFYAGAGADKHVRAVRTMNGGGGGSGGQAYSFNFDNGLENWTSIDADGDGFGWTSSLNPGLYHNSGVNLSGTGHNASQAYVISGSYANQTQTALTPDNYLVSPQKFTISSGANISFYVCAQDADYPAEHYGVAISNSSNPTANSFVTVWEETLSAKVKSGDRIRGNRIQGNWYLKTIDLSAYAGQTIWIAIRHFNCTDQFVLNVDDITIVTGY